MENKQQRHRYLAPNTIYPILAISMFFLIRTDYQMTLSDVLNTIQSQNLPVT